MNRLRIPLPCIAIVILLSCSGIRMTRENYSCRSPEMEFGPNILFLVIGDAEAELELDLDEYIPIPEPKQVMEDMVFYRTRFHFDCWSAGRKFFTVWKVNETAGFMESIRVELNDGRIAACLETGSGRQSLLLHGNSLNKESFLSQLESSLADRFHLVAVDFPGHGETTASVPPEQIIP